MTPDPGFLPMLISDPHQLLRTRAQALARPPVEEIFEGESIEILEFRLASERYAVETSFVREVLPLRELTPLPGTPPFVLGIVNVRGRILPVYDIKKFFDLPDQGLTDLHRILLIQGHGLELGLLADAIAGTRTLPLEVLHPPLPTFTGVRAEYLRGLTAEGLVVLDLERLLTDPKIIVHEEAEP